LTAPADGARRSRAPPLRARDAAGARLLSTRWRRGCNTSVAGRRCDRLHVGRSSRPGRGLDQKPLHAARPRYRARQIATRSRTGLPLTTGASLGSENQLSGGRLRSRTGKIGSAGVAARSTTPSGRARRG
jgi:hypothetical protein